MFIMKDYFISCCDTVTKLVGEYDTSCQKQHVSDMFDNWIKLYDLKDEYPQTEGYETVYERNFVGPIQQFSDYEALGYKKQLEDFRKVMGSDMFALYDIQDKVINYIDGNRSENEIIRRCNIECGKDVTKSAAALIRLLEELNLISAL